MSAGREGLAQTHQRASSAYEAANSELATLGLPRPIAALEARISSLLANPLADTPHGKCGTLDGDYTRKWCPVVADLKVELAKAKRKAKLEVRAGMLPRPFWIKHQPLRKAIRKQQPWQRLSQRPPGAKSAPAA